MKPIPTETATDVGSVGRWLGAAAAGALLMYLLDPERGSARRSRALSAVRAAGARTGATVDHALHSAGDRLAGLKDSAAGALSRGAGRLQAQTAPMLERARHGAQEATHRLEDSAERIRERAKAAARDGSSHSGARIGGAGTSPGRYESEAGHASGRYGSYEPSRRYGAESRGRGDSRDAGDVGAAHPALVGGGMLGMLRLMRRSPGGLLVGLAGLALLWQSTRDKTYRVSDNMADDVPRIKHHGEPHGTQHDKQDQAPMIPPAEQSGSRYLH